MTPRNPFASRFVRPGAMPFLFPSGIDATRLVERLAAAGWRGAIVGPHGSGKSTLLAALMPHLHAAGRRVLRVTLHDNQRRLPSATWTDPRDCDILVIDGYEQLGLWERWRVLRQKTGLLVTSHRSVALPELWRTAVTVDVAMRVVERLAEGQAPGDLADCLSRRRGNLREVLFDLYDDHERRRWCREVNPPTSG